MADAAAAPWCSLEARQLKERAAWIATLNDRFLRDRRRRGSTLILSYEPEALHEVEEMVRREKECCASADFDLRMSNGAVELAITVPREQEANADAFFAFFNGSPTNDGESSCCGACDRPVERVSMAHSPDKPKADRVVGTAAATAATAAVACSVCCIVPVAIPAIALTTGGSVVAWFGTLSSWATDMAFVMVAGGWLWVLFQTFKAKARPASATLYLMGSATVALGVALMWPHLEPVLVATLRG